MNYLENLVCEWYEFTEHIVIRNKRVGKRETGGWDGELDVVAYCPRKNRILHIECSNDSLSWKKREEKFRKKFESGIKHIPKLFPFHNFKNLGDNPKFEIEQIAILGQVEATGKTKIGGAKVQTLKEFMEDIIHTIRLGYIDENKAMVIPEQYQLLRTIYYTTKYFNNTQFL